MDLVKIGSYIAEKRKKLGMTQKQLAEKLGKSDKSVSKWERGICLPDMSTFEMIMRMGQELKTQNFEEPKSATQHLIF